MITRNLGFIFLLYLVYFCSCAPAGNRQENKDQQSEIQPTTQENKPVKLDTATVIAEAPSEADYTQLDTNGVFSGVIRLINGQFIFKPCIHPEMNFVVSNELDNDLQGKYQKNKPMLSFPGEPVNAQLEGNLNYDSRNEKTGTFKVNKIIELKQRNIRNNCMPEVVFALGNEPNWSLLISPKENTIIFKDMGEMLCEVLPYKKPTLSGNNTVYTIDRKEENPPLKINIQAGKCGDTMSDHSYDLSIEVSSGSRKWRGCGKKF